MSAQSFTLLSDATIVAPKTFTLTSDAYIVSSEFLILLSDAVIATPAKTFTLSSDAVIVAPEPINQHAHPPGRFCGNRIDTCLPCNDDPLLNTSSEKSDVPVFCATATFVGNPGISNCNGGGENVCTRIVCSEISYQDAYLKAYELARQCVEGSWSPGSCPPICPPDCPPDCPPNCPPDCPPNCCT